MATRNTAPLPKTIPLHFGATDDHVVHFIRTISEAQVAHIGI
jgi:hypothetical protein